LPAWLLYYADGKENTLQAIPAESTATFTPRHEAVAAGSNISLDANDGFNVSGERLCIELDHPEDVAVVGNCD
jgi:hypothetical protein